MRRTNLGLLVLGVIGGIVIWRNRFEIQEFLESRGLRTPLLRDTVGDTVRSGIAKLRGSVKEVVEPVQSHRRSA